MSARRGRERSGFRPRQTSWFERRAPWKSTAKVQLEVREETFDSLASGWFSLFNETPDATVFVSHLWQRIWWERFAGDADLKLLSFRRDGRLVAISPLMLHDRRVTFLGEADLVDYHDILLHSVEPRDILDALFCELERSDSWDTIDLESLPDWSPVFAEIPEAAARRGWMADVSQEDVAPGLHLPRSWDEYLAGLGKKDRHELRRKMRKLNSAGEAFQRVYTSSDDIAHKFDDFARLHRMSTPGKAEFFTPEREAFFRTVAVELANNDMVRLYFLELDGKPVATSLCFEIARSRLIYNSGFDPEYRGLSVGVVNHAMLLQRSMDEGIEFVDFLRGNERYKYDLGASDRGLYRVIVTR